MHDVKAIRDDPAAFAAGLARRGLAVEGLIDADTRARGLQTRLQDLLAERNEASKAIGAAKAAKDEARAAVLMAQVAHLKQAIPVLEAEAGGATEEIAALLAGLPNIPAPDAPDGADEHANVAVKHWGTPREDAAAREHFDIGAPLGLDFESAAAVSGSRFAYLRGPMARLNRALGQFMLDSATASFAYEEVAPPVLVRDEAMFGTAQLPKFAEDSFQTSDGRWLIPTAEVSLTNLVRDKILSEAELPLRFTALTPCFRSEAGAAGRDTRGLVRQHQFDKVELVSITTPDAAPDEHERMTAAAEAILEALDLPYRRMLLCTGDMGFAARKTYDLEVWLPGQGRYREISSCSNCGDFQARRMMARYRPAPAAAGDRPTPRFVHTLNGSALAVGRTLVAVLENYQQADGAVAVPSALVSYMNGITRLDPPSARAAT